jgi:phosphoglycolate phosphatase
VIEARNLGDCGPLDRFIGPPVEEWAIELMPDRTDEERAELARDYRACYDRVGWSDNSVFAGITEMLTDLERRGFPMYVCTSKAEHFAIRILEKFELAQFFVAIYGDKADYASHDKVDLLRRLLSERSLDRPTAWMVGDRVFDFEAARANGIRSLAAGWGYGPAEECATADAIAATPAAVCDIVSASPSPSTEQTASA